jgi:hypothetical protein
MPGLLFVHRDTLQSLPPPAWPCPADCQNSAPAIPPRNGCMTHDGHAALGRAPRGAYQVGVHHHAMGYPQQHAVYQHILVGRTTVTEVFTHRWKRTLTGRLSLTHSCMRVASTGLSTSATDGVFRWYLDKQHTITFATFVPPPRQRSHRHRCLSDPRQSSPTLLTESPTTQGEPTQSPIESPTTQSPTPSPIELPTTQSPTPSPIESPTMQSPTLSPTHSPTEFPTRQAPTQSPTESSTTQW